DGDELWSVSCEFIEISAHSCNFELMDRVPSAAYQGVYPLTLATLEEWLRQGQVFRVERSASSTFAYALWFRDGRFLLREGKDVHPFNRVEPALFVLLSRLGVFTAASQNQ